LKEDTAQPAYHRRAVPSVKVACDRLSKLYLFQPIFCSFAMARIGAGLRNGTRVSIARKAVTFDQVCVAYRTFGQKVQVVRGLCTNTCKWRASRASSAVDYGRQAALSRNFGLTMGLKMVSWRQGAEESSRRPRRLAVPLPWATRTKRPQSCAPLKFSARWDDTCSVPTSTATLQPANDRRLVFTSSQAALYLGVSLATIRRWTDAGHISCYRTPGGQRRFSRAQLEDFISSMQDDGHSARRTVAAGRVA
jgi:excisionase family DNA binding protein